MMCAAPREQGVERGVARRHRRVGDAFAQRQHEVRRAYHHQAELAGQELVLEERHLLARLAARNGLVLAFLVGQRRWTTTCI